MAPDLRDDAADLEETPAARPADLGTSLRWLMLFDMGVRLFVWSSALALAMWIFARTYGWPAAGDPADFRVTWRWSSAAVRFVLLYNALYILVLVAVRLLIPTPREGRYPTNSGRPAWPIVWSGLLSSITKARMFPPFPAFLVFHLCSLPPLAWVFGAVVGPRSR